MIASVGFKRAHFLLLLSTLLFICGCVFDRSYRPTDEKTIRDYRKGSGYRKSVGVIALTNTTIFKSPQVSEPFMDAFLSGLESNTGEVLMTVPGRTNAPSFLLDPPRKPSGDLDVFTLSGLARQKGMNTIVTPILMDIRVRKESKWFWLFRDVTHKLQIQTAAALYDTITGARLALKILIDDIEIDESQASMVRSGQEAQVDELISIAEEMGENLGGKMGIGIKKTLWQASVVEIEDGRCILHAGSEAGIKQGDRFSVLDAQDIVAGLDKQRYIVPGSKIGEITITRTTAFKSYGKPDKGEMPPVGSVVVAGD
jgi:hypothetical protein